MSLSRLIQSASELQSLASSARDIAIEHEAARVSLNREPMTDSEWREAAGNYARASADLNRINTRTRVLRGRIHFDAETL